MNRDSIKRTLLLAMRPQLLASPCLLDRAIAQALLCKTGAQPLESMRGAIEDVFTQYPKDALIEALDLERLTPRFEREKIGRFGIGQLTSKKSARGLWPRAIWRRRLGLAQSAGMFLDCVYLGPGESIPPHAHVGVVSGFYVVTGSVHTKHFHIDEYSRDTLIGHKTIDCVLYEGQGTTNSDVKDNVHWLQAESTGAVLFRINAINQPSPLEKENIDAGRLYVDPQAADASESGTAIPIVAREHSEALRMT